MICSKQRTFRSERCLLRYPSIDDAPALLAAVRQPQFPRDSAWGRARTPHEARALIERRQRNFDSGTDLSWTIVRRQDSLPIGLVNLSSRPRPRHFVLGFWLDPRCWGAGYTVEVCRSVLAYAFEELRVDCVSAGAALWNRRSQRVLEKLGFGVAGENPAGYHDGDKLVRTREYSMTRSDWNAAALQGSRPAAPKGGTL